MVSLQVDMVNEAARKDKEYKQQVELLNAHNRDLKTSVDQLNEKLKASEKGARGNNIVDLYQQFFSCKNGDIL